MALEQLDIADGFAARYPDVCLRRGYGDDDVRAIAGGNVPRVMRGAEAAAGRIQAERPPSEATIEALDG
jgi:hypothetical protein